MASRYEVEPGVGMKTRPTLAPGVPRKIRVVVPAGTADHVHRTPGPDTFSHTRSIGGTTIRGSVLVVESGVVDVGAAVVGAAVVDVSAMVVVVRGTTVVVIGAIDVTDVGGEVVAALVATTTDNVVCSTIKVTRAFVAGSWVAVDSGAFVDGGAVKGGAVKGGAVGARTGPVVVSLNNPVDEEGTTSAGRVDDVDETIGSTTATTLVVDVPGKGNESAGTITPGMVFEISRSSSIASEATTLGAATVGPTDVSDDAAPR